MKNMLKDNELYYRQKINNDLNQLVDKIGEMNRSLDITQAHQGMENQRLKQSKRYVDKRHMRNNTHLQNNTDAPTNDSYLKPYSPPSYHHGQSKKAGAIDIFQQIAPYKNLNSPQINDNNT